MFELIARIVAFFYSITSSHGLSILLLTALVMLVVMPLTFKSTKSMIEMRRIQPQIKKLQTKYAADREKMNQELMALYQKHGVNPVGGCLPVLVQAPVFFVLFRVVRGLTRRTVDTGWANGNALTQRALVDSGVAQELGTDLTITLDKAPTANFNPEYLSPESDMYQDLVTSNEMLSWSVDLSRSASEVIRESIPDSFPYLVMVVLTGVLSWYQQRQIQGRSTAEMPQQMKVITKIMPWMAPAFAFTLPAALGVYFIGSALFRVGQNAIISYRFYNGDEEELAIDDDDDDDDWEAPEGATPAPQPGGFLGTLMNGGEPPAGAEAGAADSRHGSRSPVQGNRSSRNRSRPPRETTAPAAEKSNPAKTSRTTPKTTPKAASKSKASANGKAAEADAGEGGLWARAKRSAAEARDESGANARSGRAKRGQSAPPAVEKKASKRVTPKGGSQTNRKKK